MNKHIELIKKFLADGTSVTEEEELKANKKAAYWAAVNYAELAVLWAASAVDAEYYKQKAREAIAEYEELTK